MLDKEDITVSQLKGGIKLGSVVIEKEHIPTLQLMVKVARRKYKLIKNNYLYS